MFCVLCKHRMLIHTPSAAESAEQRNSVRDWERVTPRVPQARYMWIKDQCERSELVCVHVLGVTDATRGGSKAVRWWDGQRDRNSSHWRDTVQASLQINPLINQQDASTHGFANRSWPRSLSAYMSFIKKMFWIYGLHLRFWLCKTHWDNGGMLLMIVRCYGALIGF